MTRIFRRRSSFIRNSPCLAICSFRRRRSKREKLPRIGIVDVCTAVTSPMTVILIFGSHRGIPTGSARLGYVEGKNIGIEYRWAEGKLGAAA